MYLNLNYKQVDLERKYGLVFVKNKYSFHFFKYLKKPLLVF